MLTLAIDTTTKAGGVAVVRGDVVLALVHGDASRTHGERLPGELERALAEACVRLDDVELIAVASGPGAFTGLRIGLAAAQGVALVSGRPVVGVSALDALAVTALARCPGQTVAAWMDAQRGEVFAARYDAQSAGGAPEAVGPPLVAPPRDVLDGLSEEQRAGACFIGEGAIRYRAEIVARAGDAVVIVDAPAALSPAIARLGQHLAARGRAGPPHALQPLYVRRPDAELTRARATPAPPDGG